MDFVNFLKDTAQKINSELAIYLEKETADSKKVSSKLAPLVQLFAKHTEGGKRLRGSLVKLGYQLVEPKENEEIYKPALAYEIVQTAILAHDDIIDKSLLRRGKPTLYQELGGDHYGVSQTMILGDIGFFLSFELISQSNFSDQSKIKAIQIFADTLLKTGAGEMLDIEIPHQMRETNEAEVIQMAHLKTAHYTIIGPLQLGAVLAGADQELLNRIEVFGENLGIAFQLQDDILGIYGTESQTGKSITSDIEEGKITLLWSEAVKRANSGQIKLLKELYGKAGLTTKQADQVSQVIIATGALDFTKAKALRYVTEAKKDIPELTNDQQLQKMLFELADFLVERKK